MKFKNLSVGYEHDLKFYNSLKIGDYILVNYDKIDRVILKIIDIEDREFPIKCEVIEGFTLSKERGFVIDNWRFGNSYTKYRKISKEELFVELL